MAIALVGSFGTVASVSGATSITPAFAQPTTAGNLLVAFMAWQDSSSLLTNTNSTGWVKALDFVSAGAGAVAGLWYKPNCGAGETAPTFFIGSNGTATFTGSACLAEYSGAATTSPLDSSGSNGSGLATSPLSSTCSAADGQAGDLVVTVTSWVLTKAGTVTTADTFNNGATPTAGANNDATSATNHYRFSWGITTGNSAADNVSESNSSMNLSASAQVIASFKPAAAATPSSVPQLTVVSQAVTRSTRWFRRHDGLVLPRRRIFVPA